MNLKKLNTKRITLLFLVLILVLSILFETFQQYYYIIKFELSPNVKFFELLKNQSYRWVIWCLLALPIYIYTSRRQNLFTVKKSIFSYGLLIFVLVISNVLLISIIEYSFASEPFLLKKFLYDYLVFFAFQKAPIFSLGYIAISIILFLYVENIKLKIGNKALGDLKTENEKLYLEIKARNSDFDKVLTVKMGNKYKAIVVENINYIEANDYCVSINTDNSKIDYAMRTSLKYLQKNLPVNFIRVHRKFIVNLNKVSEFDTKNRTMVLKNNKTLSISKSNLPSLTTYFSNTPLGRIS